MRGLITSSLMLSVYRWSKPASELGWGAGRTLGGSARVALAAALFIAREARARNPLIPLRVPGPENVTGENLVQVLTVAGMLEISVLGSLYLERILGYDALRDGPPPSCR